MTRSFRTAISAAILAGALALAFSPSTHADDRAGAPDPALFRDLERFHGHTCAGSLFGARIGAAARDAVRAAGGTGKLKAVYHDHSCPVDGIQMAAGTTYGNKALAVDDRDEARLVLTAEGNGRSVEARLTKAAEGKGLRSRELGKKARALPEGSAERERLVGEIEAIHEWFRTAPTPEIVSIRPL